MRSVYQIFICLCSLVRFGSALKVRLADGSLTSHSITDLHHCSEPNFLDHPHLFASPDRLYVDIDQDISQISHPDDVAVVFHSMQGAGRSLLLSKLNRGNVPDSIIDTAGFHMKIRFQDQINALHILNPASYAGNASEIESQVRRTRSVIQAQELPLKRIFVIVDLNTLDESYADHVDRYLQQLYQAHESSQFTLVLNKADTVTGPEQAQRKQLLKRQRFIASQIDGIDLISVSARDCIGPLVSRLKDAIKSVGDGPGGMQPDHRQLAVLKASTDLTASMLKSVKATLESMNFMPPGHISCPLVKSSDLANTQQSISLLRWTLDWLKAGHKRSKLMRYLYESNPDLVDTKSNYDQYLSFWTKRQDDLERFMKRIELLEQMDSKLNEFASICSTLEADLTFEIDQRRLAKRARLRLIEGFRHE